VPAEPNGDAAVLVLLLAPNVKPLLPVALGAGAAPNGFAMLDGRESVGGCEGGAAPNGFVDEVMDGAALPLPLPLPLPLLLELEPNAKLGVA